MPGVDDDTITQIEQALSNIEPVSKMIEKGYTPEQILEAVLGEGNVEFLGTKPVSFSCNCSKERFSNALIGVGEVELQAMIDEDHGAEAQCHFCMEKYQYSEDELTGMIEEIRVQKASK